MSNETNPPADSVLIFDTQQEKRILFMEPHSDDVVFSCGGTMLKHMSSGDHIHCICVFSLISDHETPENVRVQEGISVFRDSLEADILFLDHKIGSIEKWGKPGSEGNLTLFIGTSRKVYRELRYWIGRMKPDCIYAPIGIGNHVDHIIVNTVMKKLSEEMTDIEFVFYEDFPYCLDDNQREAGIENLCSDVAVKGFSVNIDSFMNEKLRLVSLYKSQINALEEFLDEIRNYCARRHKMGITVPGTYFETLYIRQ